MSWQVYRVLSRRYQRAELEMRAAWNAVRGKLHDAAARQRYVATVRRCARLQAVMAEGGLA